MGPGLDRTRYPWNPVAVTVVTVAGFVFLPMKITKKSDCKLLTFSTDTDVTFLHPGN